MAKKSKSFLKAPFLKRLILLPERMQTDGYPFTLPILEDGKLELTFDRPITFFIGDNGTGKSTLLEAIAKHCGFGLGGGSRHHQFGGGAHDQPLAQSIVQLCGDSLPLPFLRGHQVVQKLLPRRVRTLQARHS